MTARSGASAAELTTCWPSPDQELLLRAAMSPPAEAGEAFAMWQRAQDIHNLDEGSRRLLPMVYRNLRRNGVLTALDMELKRAYLETSAENQKRLVALENVLGVLHENDVPTLVLKGAALTLFHYRDRGVRPMADLDVMVPIETTERALSALRGDGWAFHGIGRKTPVSRLLSIRHAASLQRGDDELDLHWHALAECMAGELDRSFWAAAINVYMGGEQTRILAPADQLVHSFVHGLRYNPVPPVRWITDTYAVLTSSSDDLDWTRVVRHAERHRLVAPVASALEYVHHLLPGHIPPHVVHALRLLPITDREQREFDHTTRSHRLIGAWGVEWLRYRRRAPDRGPLRRAVGFVSELRVQYELDHLWQLPARIGHGVVRRCARVLRPPPRVRGDRR